MKRQRHITGQQEKQKSEWKGAMICAIMMVLVLLLFSPLQAAAGKGKPDRERFVLDFGDSHFRGNPTLFLKRELLNQYPGINISEYLLRRVVLVAKTKKGYGSAQLRVGPELSPHYRVHGEPRAFHSHHPDSFDRIRIGNPFHDSWGPWQLFLQGNFKVRKVILVVEKRPHAQYGYGYSPYHHFQFKMRW